MIRAKVLEVHRKSGSIRGYTVQDTQGAVREISSVDLKRALRTGEIALENYFLTKDGRLYPSPDRGNDYYLMNKDSIVAKFNLNSNSINVIRKLPIGFSGIRDWIDQRAKFSCARDVKSFFSSIGIMNASDFIEVTHCVALTDTFWVKGVSSKLRWGNVSPFRNDYSRVISAYALEGVNIRGENKNYLSPDISTGGTFPHTWKYNGGNILFVKAGSKYTLGGSNSGREPYSEYYASVIGKFLGFNILDYTIKYHRRHDNRVDCVTECKCFTSEKVGSVPAYRLGLHSYEDVLNYCKRLSKKDFETCLDMYFLDCLLVNTDRHFGNIEFFIDNDTLKVLGIVPIYDNNYSLVPRLMEGYEDFRKEDYMARDGRSFEDLYSLVKGYKSYTRELIRLKKFRLEKPRNVDIEDKRLAFLNDFLQERVDYLLSLRAL